MIGIIIITVSGDKTKLWLCYLFNMIKRKLEYSQLICISSSSKIKWCHKYLSLSRFFKLFLLSLLWATNSLILLLAAASTCLASISFCLLPAVQRVSQPPALLKYFVENSNKKLLSITVLQIIDACSWPKLIVFATLTSLVTLYLKIDHSICVEVSN